MSKEAAKDVVKVNVTGTPGVGKSTLLSAYTSNQAQDPSQHHAADSPVIDAVTSDSTAISLALWNVVGAMQESYERLRPMSYPGTNVFLIVFSLTDRISFVHVKNWVEDISRYGAAGTPFILVATKVDAQPRTVTKEEAEAVASTLGAEQYHETSAVSMQGVADVFQAAIDIGHKHVMQSKEQRRRKEKKNAFCCIT